MVMKALNFWNSRCLSFCSFNLENKWKPLLWRCIAHLSTCAHKCSLRQNAQCNENTCCKH